MLRKLLVEVLKVRKGILLCLLEDHFTKDLEQGSRNKIHLKPTNVSKIRMKLFFTSLQRSVRTLQVARGKEAAITNLVFRTYTVHSSPTKLERLTLTKHRNTICYTKEGDENSDICFIAIHGGPGSHKDFRHLTTPFSEILVKKGYDHIYKDRESVSHQLLRFDLPGYGSSDRMPLLPTAENFADQVLDTIEALQLRQKKKKIVLIGHSLGGHIVARIANKMQHELHGLILLASVCLRPHRILGDEEYYWINQWLGENVNNSIYGEAVKTVLEIGYKNFANFPRSSKREEIAWTQQRVALLDWEGFENDIRSTRCPILFSYATDDHILQPERFRELADLINEHDNSQFQISLNTIKEYSNGGHNIQKTKAVELTKLIKSWLFYIDVVHTSESLGLQLNKMKSLDEVTKLRKVLVRDDLNEIERMKRETGL